MKRSLLGSVFATGVLLSGACTQTPGTPSVSFAAPVASTPSNGSSFKFSAQPITLTLTNAVRTTPAAVTYAIEIASDAGFATKVFTKTDIPESESGGNTTSIQIGSLAGATTYYWRSMATLDGVTGAPSAVRTFAIEPQVVLNVPGQLIPDANSKAVDSRPAFRVSNATRSGPAGAIFYEFQVSASSSFSPLTTSGSVAEQSGQTTWVPNVDIPVGTYFWRVQATDPSNDVKSGFSGARQFTLEPFSLKNAVIHNNPPDIGSWAETATITSIAFSSGRIEVDFDKRDGPGRWPDVTPRGWDGPLQYTLGMCLFIANQWHCSAAIQFWHGRELSEGGDTNLVAADWFYDARWGEMLGHQPSFGEIIGIFVVAGNVRDDPTVAVFERSNVQFVPFGTDFSR